jgi:hypothetical protein
MNDLSHDELVSIPGPALAGLMDRGLVDCDVRGHLFVTLAGQCLRARSARDQMLMRLGLRPGPEQEDEPAPVSIRTGPDSGFTIRITDDGDLPPHVRHHLAQVGREARLLAEARQAARLAGEVEIDPPADAQPQLKAV